MSVSVDAKGISEKVFDNFKKITPALVVLSISSALILFLPESFLMKMSLDKLPDIWKRIIGIIFILSTSLIIVIITIIYLRKTKPKRFCKKMRKNFIGLPVKYKDLLIKLLNDKDRCMNLNPYSGDTLYLVNNMFIYRSQSSKLYCIDEDISFLYAPHPWLIDLFEKEPDLFINR